MRFFQQTSLLLFLFICLRPCSAQWGTSATSSTLVATGNIFLGAAVPDLTGGAYLIYMEASESSRSLNGQHVDATGQNTWGGNGKVVWAAEAFPIYDILAAPDNVGGVILSWLQLNEAGTTWALRLHRFSVAGSPLWGASGVEIPLSDRFPGELKMEPDDSGGVYLAWLDYRNGKGSIYAQRVNSDGQPVWNAGGMPVCTTPFQQLDLRMQPDPAGGILLAWSDFASHVCVYAQKLSPAGMPMWQVNGQLVCDIGPDAWAYYPAICTDGNGGALLSWIDQRVDAQFDIYAQRLDSSGAPVWKSNGVPVCSAPSYQSPPEMIPDDSDGAIISWKDGRREAPYPWEYNDLYAQRIGGNGSAKWTSNGLAVCAAHYVQHGHTLVPDGAGGAVFGWSDERRGQRAYAQRIMNDGEVKWSANGEPVSSALSRTDRPFLIPDATSSPIMVWTEPNSAGRQLLAARLIDKAPDPVRADVIVLNLQSINQPPAVVIKYKQDQLPKLATRFSLRNVGHIATGPLTVGYYLSADTTLDDSDLLLAQKGCKPIAKDALSALKVKVAIPTGTVISGKYLLIVSDSLHVEPEMDEQNNILPYGPLP